jgi:hypothetical protein
VTPSGGAGLLICEASIASALVGVLIQMKFEFLAELGFLPPPLQPPPQFPNEPVHVGSWSAGRKTKLIAREN